MARRNAKRRAPSARKPAGSLLITNPNAAAIDVHSDNHVVWGIVGNRGQTDLEFFVE